VSSEGYQASFKGFEFIDDEAVPQISTGNVPHETLGRAGAEILAQAPGVELVRVTAVFNGLDYAKHVQFVRLLTDGKPGPFTHPIYGLWPSAAPLGRIEIKHPRGTEEYCEIPLLFAKDRTPESVLFGGPIVATAINAAALDLSAFAPDLISPPLLPNFELPGWVSELRGLLLSGLFQLDLVLRKVTRNAMWISTSISNLTEFPQTWADRFAGALDSILDAYESILDAPNDFMNSVEAAFDSILDVFERDQKLPSADLDGMMEGTTEFSASHPMSAEITAYCSMRSLCSGHMCKAAGMAIEYAATDTDPRDIERVMNCAREHSRKSLNLLDAIYGNTTADATEALRRAAAEVRELAEARIVSRPPLISYELRTDTPVVVLAHELYGDYERHAEIESLNTITTPYLVPAGTALQVYAP